MKIVEATSVSSDKQWTARALAAFPPPGDDYYTQLTVRRADGSLSWTVVDRWDPLGLGYTTPQPFLWSRDGHSLYITNRPRPDGCTAFVNAYDLYKLDLSDGKLSQVAPGLGLWLSLSPDEKTLAYAGWRASEQALRFVLRDLATGNERALPGPQARTDHFANDEIGQIQWSPDAAALVYTIAVRPCKGPYPSASVWTESTSIMRVDASSLQQTALIREDERAFITLAWSSPDKVTLKDRAGQTWVMNPVSGQVSKEQ